MGLEHFIETNLDAILHDWREFASTRLPAAQGLRCEELENSARHLLEAIASDMGSRQSAGHQEEKSRGERSAHSPVLAKYGQEHAADRFEQGFTADQLVAEYRALRATVLRHWDVHTRSGIEDVRDIVRFNEGIDECLTESLAWYGERANEARDLFLAALGHDLRNPLGAVIMSTQAILRDESLSLQSTKAAVIALNSGSRMRRMLNELLDFTASQLGGRMKIKTAYVPLCETFRHAVEELSTFHSTAQLHFECKDGLYGYWDADRLVQVVSNLVGNAIQHGKVGAPIQIVAAEIDDEMVLTVHNEGPPIAPDLQAKIFEPMTRGVMQPGARPGGQGSLGLGLYISQQIARAHRGSIEVRSTAEEGTTFTVRLPRARESV